MQEAVSTLHKQKKKKRLELIIDFQLIYPVSYTRLHYHIMYYADVALYIMHVIMGSRGSGKQ